MLPPIVNRKMNQQNPPAPTFGRQNLLPTTTQTQTLHLSQRSSAENQDLQPANDMPMIGASSTQMDFQQQQSDIQASDRSDIDLPPEFAALFHVSYSFYFSLVLDEESCPNLSEVIIPQDSLHSVKFSLPLFRQKRTFVLFFVFLFVPRWVRET